jgi:TetR/AcrR family fatty acid metabolism transcriptional regulator
MKSTRAEQRIDQIIEATFKCIAQRGYENLTMQTLSEHSRLSRGAINHYFKKKEDILVAVLEALDRKLFKLVDDKLKGSTHLEPEDYMRIRLSGTFELAKDDPAFMYVITDFLSLAMNNAVHKRGIRKFFRKYRYLSSVGLKPGLASGEFRGVKPEVLGALVMAVIFGVGIQWVLDKNAFDFDAVTRVAEDMVILYLKQKE